MEMNVVKTLQNYILSRSPAVYLHTSEDLRADAILTELCKKLEYEPMEWNLAYGWVDFKNKSVKSLDDSGKVCLSTDLASLLDEELDNRLIVIKHADLALSSNPPDANSVARLHQLLNRIQRHQENAAVILVADTINIPRLIEGQVKLVELPVPQRKERKSFIRAFCKREKLNIRMQLLTQLVTACAGLSEQDIHQVLLMAIRAEGSLNEKALDFILIEKRQIIAKSGVLEMIQTDQSFKDIGGLANIKNWLNRRAQIFSRLPEAIDFGIHAPKGVLIAGMPGCGKSLTAKAAAELFQLPLLRLDMGSLLGKYVGESEGNMRRALMMAESINPCVLWVDELEKAFAGASGSNGSEVTTRLLGYFLTWLQEKKSAVFVVATANNISVLPPELLRKGRFDEVFYVGFPNTVERNKIFEIHLQRTKKDIQHLNLSKLATKSRDYSGSDIENVINEALEVAFVDGKNNVTEQNLLDAIKNTVPLRETIKDQIAKYEEIFDKLKLKPASEEQGLSTMKLLEMSKDPNVVQREKAASDDNCPEDILKTLSNDKNELSVRRAVINNENCSMHTITSFINIDKKSEYFDQGIFEKAILHCNAPGDLLARLIDEKKLEKSLLEKLFIGLIASKIVPTELQKNIYDRFFNKEKSKKENALQVDFASVENLRDEIQIKLSNHECNKLREALAKNRIICESAQETLAVDGNQEVRLRLAGNPTITDRVVDILRKDEVQEIGKKVMHFKNRANYI